LNIEAILDLCECDAKAISQAIADRRSRFQDKKVTSSNKLKQFSEVELI